MANGFYNASGNPGTGSEGLSATMRAEFLSIQAAFDLMPRIGTTGLFDTIFAQAGSYTFTLPGQAGTIALTSDVAAEAARAMAAEAARAMAAEALRAPLASPALTGAPLSPTAAPGTSTTQIATTAFVQAAASALVTGVSSVAGRSGAVTLGVADVSGAAPLASPTLTGVPIAPTAAPGTNTTQVATTAFSAAAVLAETTRALAAEAAVTAIPSIGRNYADNSRMAVQQSGQGPFTASGYTVDQHKLTAVMSTGSVSVTAIVPTDADRAAAGDESMRTALKIVYVGGSAASDVIYDQTVVPGVARLSNQTVAVSFRASAAAADTLGLNVLQNFGTGGSPSAAVVGVAQTQAIGTAFGRYTKIFSIPSISGKTLGTNRNDYTAFQFFFSSGTTNAAQAGVGVKSGAITYTDLQIEIGPSSTQFEKKRYSEELANCQVFYQTGIWSIGAYNGANAYSFCSSQLLCTMRDVPTLTYTLGSSNNVIFAQPSILDASTIQSVLAPASTGAGSASGTYTLSARIF